ncbi:hypothetical protein [Thiocapsa roseopersicina]|uniref:Uncharacterized protein n=1 Tax=Thiocapsa roseopersicina TaxID=1058 RepID=A0A1H2QC68_THIRO|nr:hypothetical protein [Thiocapsa roseopersicina]SDW04761.1 hypothetical protein SAMN05421783_101214 [Thiocapsa roseopersicina]
MTIEYSADEDDIFRPLIPILYRDEEYEQSGFETLSAMQERHFCYRGRHRFLLA